ncbi:beta-propeller fold lactonase family protein [Leifsonia sp. fls2-241-R2A-40a]|uniref:lactonase family protein n=1 Tax=Leifsonia sp. fls2-241-R2A-40a TaxID=3040290 RepID=UPI00254C84BE|nr:beta-propeller fold lactonase family protein [Leifsonia sp. fls2-241-R2A-40a]
MRTALRLALASAAAVAATALFAAPALAAPSPSDASPDFGGRASSAVFVQTDGVNGNAVVAYDRGPGGSLNPAGTYPTGGLGGVLTGSVVDHLASQGSLVYDRGLLYAVNAGSNTVTVFAVHGDHLIRRQVIGSGGAFPVSVTTHGGLVYVLNARNGGSVQGYVRVADFLVRVPVWNRPLGLDPSLTPEFTHTPGQVAFTPDGSKLVVTTKANGSAVDVFGVDRLGGLSQHPVSNVLSGAVPFAVTYDAGGHLVIAEAGTNSVATFTIAPSGTLTPIAAAATGQAATCWIARDGALLYASNAGSASLSGYADPGAGTLTAVGTTPTGPGTVDAAASSDGRFLYVQTGGNGGVDEFRVNPDGSLTSVGSVVVPGAVGGEGIAAL